MSKEETYENLNLYQKLARITGEVGVVAKDGDNREQHFKFIEYAAVAGKLRSLFAKYGVVVVPRMQQVNKQVRHEITSSQGKTGYHVLIEMFFDVVNADKPADHFNVRWTGEATDYGDKATNKAATAALKYYLMRQFNISEKGEDADADSHDIQAQPKPAVKNITMEQREHIDALFTELGIRSLDKRREIVDAIIKRRLPLGHVITEAEARRVVTALQLRIDENDIKAEQVAAEPAQAVDDIDKDIAQLYAESQEQPEHSVVYALPEYPGDETSKLTPLQMTQDIAKWRKELGWTEAELANLAASVIGKPKPGLRSEALALLGAMTDELNKREAERRLEQ